MKAAVTLLLGLFALTSHAAQFTLVAPTQNDDNSSLPAAQITGYQVNCGNTAGGPYTVVNAVRPAAPLTFNLDFAPGAWFCTARTLANGQTSGPSNERTFTVALPKPKPPILN